METVKQQADSIARVRRLKTLLAGQGFIADDRGLMPGATLKRSDGLHAIVMRRSVCFFMRVQTPNGWRESIDHAETDEQIRAICINGIGAEPNLHVAPSQ